MTSSSSAAARPASGSCATPPCGASARSWSSGWTSARAPPAASTACCTPAGATWSATPGRPPSAPRRTRSCAASPPRRSRTPAASSSPRRPTTPATPTGSSPAARATGVPVQEIPVAEALAREPRLNPGISRAFEVADASVDAWKLLWGNARSAQEHGARDPHLPLGHRDPARRRPDRSARVAPRRPRRRRGAHRGAASSINAGGVWAGQIADMADCPGVTRGPRQGDHDRDEPPAGAPRWSTAASPPGDGDILVPIRTVCVIGTTDVEGRQPRRPRDRPRRGAADARRRRGAGPGLPPGARAARLDRGAAAVQGRARGERATTPAT